MKFSAALVAITATLAAASPKPYKCTPATYQCSTGYKQGWQVCSTAGVWVDGGSCPPNTVCKFLPANGSPYCVPPDYTIPGTKGGN